MDNTNKVSLLSNTLALLLYHEGSPFTPRLS